MRILISWAFRGFLFLFWVGGMLWPKKRNDRDLGKRGGGEILEYPREQCDFSIRAPHRGFARG